MARLDQPIEIEVTRRDPMFSYIGIPKWDTLDENNEGYLRIDCAMANPHKEAWEGKPRIIYQPQAYLQDTLVGTGSSMDYTYGRQGSQIKIWSKSVEDLGLDATLSLYRIDRKEPENDIIIDNIHLTLHRPSDNKFIVRTPRVEQIFYPIEVFQEPLFGFWVPTPFQFPRALSCDLPPCEFELTEANGFKEGKHYVFQSSLSVAPGVKILQVVPEEQVYKFEGTTIIDLVPITDVISEVICGLSGIEPGSEECKLALAEFIDPIYVANVFSKILFHEDLAGNEGEPDILDTIFVPLALASGIIPMGGMIKNTMGPILKGAAKGGVVAKWLERNKALVHAAGLAGDEIDSAVALDRIKGASKAAEGSDNQAALLEEAYRIMEGMVKDTKLTAAEVAQKQKAVVGAVTEKIDNVKPKSKTTAEKVVKDSGLEDAAHVVPGVRELDPKNVSVFRRVLDQLIGKRPKLAEIDGEMCELVSYYTKNGELTKNWKPFAPGFWGWLKRERLRATIFAAIIVMFPWWFADNLVFLIYILRYADVLDKTWGEQWKRAIETVKAAYWDMQNFGACEEEYQAMYISGIDTMRRLLEGADPIPEDKLAKAKYNIEVCYAIRIGDPNEFVNEAAWKVLMANELTYTKMVMGCEDPLIPAGGLKTPVIPNPMYVAKIERVVDGDTFEISSNDPTWPFEQDKQVRLLGVDTPDNDGAGNYSVRRKVIPDKDAPEDPILDVHLEDYQRATRAAQLIIEKQEVTLEIDLDNPYDTTPMQRVLATVWVDRQDTVIDGVVITEGYTGDFGKKQLALGNACVFFYTPNSIFGPEKRAEYIKIETTAKEDKKGVWGTDAPSMPKGKIHCRSAPSSAWIYLDDETAPKGDTEMTITDVRIGKHTVEFRGTASCIDCSCDYDVTVKEDTTEEAFCELSAIYDVSDAYWDDENNVRTRVKSLVDPMFYINGTTNVLDGCYMVPIGIHAPGKLTFGRKYTDINEYTPLEVAHGAGTLETDGDFGKRRIELQQEGYKTLYEVIDMTRGKRVTRVAEMIQGNREDYIKLGGTGPGTLHVTVYDGETTLNLVKANISVRDSTGAEQEAIHTDETNITNLAVMYNPYTLTVTADGYDTYVKSGVLIAHDSTTNILVYLTGNGGEVESGKGTLHVTVRNSKTKDLIKALISARDYKGLEQESITSDNTNIKLLVAGNPYSLHVSRKDYTAQHIPGITIIKDTTIDQNVELTPGAGTEGETEVTIYKPYSEIGGKHYLDDAVVYIDGVLEASFTSASSTVVFGVKSGTHTITLKCYRYNDLNITENIGGERYTLSEQEMTGIHAATIVDPRTYPTDFNVGYKVMCPITIVNASDADATFVVSQIFEGIDVIYTMVFTSETTSVPAGAGKEVKLPVTIPIEAIPVGMDIANYDILTRLEVV